MQLGGVLGLLIGFIYLEKGCFAWALLSGRIGGTGVTRRNHLPLLPTPQCSSFRLYAENEYISAIYIGDSMCFDDPIEKKDILRLLDCITSPSDSTDDDFDYEKDRIRRELLRYNDISSLREECHRRDIVPSVDKRELLTSLLLHKLNPNITVTDKRQGLPDPIPTLPLDIFDDLIQSQTSQQRQNAPSFLDTLPESEEFRLLRGRPRIAGVAQPRPVLLDGLDRREVVIPSQRFLRPIHQAETDDALLRKSGISGIQGYVARQRVIGSADMSISSSSVTVLVSDGNFRSLEMRLLADEIASSTSQTVVLLDVIRHSTQFSQDTSLASLEHSLSVSRTKKYSDEVRLRQMDDLLSAVLYCSTTLLSPSSIHTPVMDTNSSEMHDIGVSRDTQTAFQKKNNVQIVAIGETAGVVLETLTLQQCLAVSHAVPEILRHARPRDTDAIATRHWEIDEDAVSHVLQQFNLLPLPKMSDHYCVPTHTADADTACVVETHLGNFTVKLRDVCDKEEYTVNWRDMLRDTPNMDVEQRDVSQAAGDTLSDSDQQNNLQNNVNNVKNNNINNVRNVNVNDNKIHNINNDDNINIDNVSDNISDNISDNDSGNDSGNVHAKVDVEVATNNRDSHSTETTTSQDTAKIPTIEEMERMFRDTQDTDDNHNKGDQEVDEVVHGLLGGNEEVQGSGRSGADWTTTMKTVSRKIVSQLLNDPRHAKDVSRLFSTTTSEESVSQDVSHADAHFKQTKIENETVFDDDAHVSRVSHDPYSRYSRFMSLPQRLKKVFQLHDTLRHNSIFQKYAPLCPKDSDVLCSRHMHVSSVISLFPTHYDTAAVATTLRLPVFLLCCDTQLYNNEWHDAVDTNQRLRHRRVTERVSVGDLFTADDTGRDTDGDTDRDTDSDRGVSSLLSVPGLRREDVLHWTTAVSRDYKSFTDVSLIAVPQSDTAEDATKCASDLLCRASPSNLLSEVFPFLFSLETNNRETVSFEQVCQAFQLAVLRHTPPVLLEDPENSHNHPDSTQRRTLGIWDSVQSRQTVLSLVGTWLDIYSGDTTRTAGVAGCFKVTHQNALGHRDRASEERHMKRNVEKLVRHYFERDRDTPHDTSDGVQQMKPIKTKNKLFNDIVNLKDKKTDNNEHVEFTVENSVDSLSLIRKLTFPPLVRDTRVSTAKNIATRMWSSGDWLRFAHIDTATQRVSLDSDSPETHQNRFELSETAAEQWRILEDWKILNKMSVLLHWSPAAVRRLQHWLRHTFSSRDTPVSEITARHIDDNANWKILKRLAYDKRDTITDQDRDTLCRWLKEARHCYDTPVFASSSSGEEKNYLDSETALWK